MFSVKDMLIYMYNRKRSHIMIFQGLLITEKK